MATATKASKSAKTIAERWAAGTEHYQQEFRPVAERISKRAKEMHDEGAEPAEIVAMAVEENKKFAAEYHDHE